MKRQGIDQIFHQKLGKLEVTPESNTWAKIQSQVTTAQAHQSALWIRVAAAAAILVLGGIVLARYMTISSVDQPMADQIVNMPLEKAMPIVEPGQETSATRVVPEKNEVSNRDHEVAGSQSRSEDANPISNRSIPNSVQTAWVTASVIPENDNQVVTPVNLNISISLAGIHLEDIGAIASAYRPEMEFREIDIPDVESIESGTGIRRAFDLVLAFKNGDETLIDLRKTKQDLFTLAKNITTGHQAKAGSGVSLD